MAQIDWRFMQPLDQSNQIAAMTAGNQQINAGLAAMGGAVTGYADALKQRNTDEILNALYQAQTSADLPNAMSAVNALQQKYGRGFDQAAVRNAIDSRSSTLGQRDLQAINLQQAQAAQAAIPQLNQMALAQAKARGVDVSGYEQAAGLGVDVTSQLNNFANQMVNDTRDARDFKYRSEKDTRDFNYRQQRDAVGDAQWEAGNDRANMDAAYRYSEGYVTPAQSGYRTNPDGTITPYSTDGVTRGQAFAAMSSSLAGVRGIRNNNPGNLNYAGQQGASRENGNGRFASFNTPEEGINAMSRQLDLHFTGKSAKSKEAGRPLRTVTDIIGAWAPPGENNTAKYINDVSRQLGVSPTAQLNLKDPATKAALMKAIVTKENGGNPYTDAQYFAGISGNVPRGSAQGAVDAVGAVGVGLPQATMAKITGGYNDAMAKLNADYNAQGAKDQIKGSVATTGKNVDTWVAGKKDKGLIFSNNNTFFTKATDLAKMAKADPAFNKLPENAQMNVLEGAYAKMNDVNAFQYVPDGDLKKFISRESQNYQKDRVNQFNQQKEAAFEQAYQSAVKEFRAIGQQPPSREGFRQLVDPQAPAPKKQQSNAQKATAAVTPRATQATQAPSYITQGARINSRNEALSQARERSTNVANAPTRKELDALKAEALRKANTKREEEAAKAAFKKLQEANKNKPLSPEMQKLLKRYGG